MRSPSAGPAAPRSGRSAGSASPHRPRAPRRAAPAAAPDLPAKPSDPPLTSAPLVPSTTRSRCRSRLMLAEHPAGGQHHDQRGEELEGGELAQRQAAGRGEIGATRPPRLTRRGAAAASGAGWEDGPQQPPSAQRQAEGQDRKAAHRQDQWQGQGGRQQLDGRILRRQHQEAGQGDADAGEQRGRPAGAAAGAADRSGLASPALPRSCQAAGRIGAPGAERAPPQSRQAGPADGHRASPPCPAPGIPAGIPACAPDPPPGCRR